MPSDPSDQQLIRSLMLHHHPSLDSPRSQYCQRIHDGRRVCRFGYPQPLQDRTTIDAEGHVHYRRRKPGNEWVVPHCLPLLWKFKCHINLKVANPSHLFQCIFKYIHKSLFYITLLNHIALTKLIIRSRLCLVPSGPVQSWSYGLFSKDQD